MGVDERYQVEDPVIQRELRTLAAQLEADLPEGRGFALFLFDQNTSGGGLFYISNSTRDTIVSTLQEWLERQAKGGAADHVYVTVKVAKSAGRAGIDAEFAAAKRDLVRLLEEQRSEQP